MPQIGSSASVVWHPWSSVPFAEAHASGRPILLLITVRWSPAGHQWSSLVESSPGLVDALRRTVVCVAVDADERPDIAERYGAGGWPTIAFLAASGAVLDATTWLAPDELGRVLDELARVYIDRGNELSTVAPIVGAVEPVEPFTAAARSLDLDDRQLLVQACLDLVWESADEGVGGFGRAPKFPHVWPLRLLLAASDPEPAGRPTRAFARRTLDVMAFGALWDSGRGGFWRRCATRDWHEPGEAKLLDVNVAMIDLLLDGAAAFADERLRSRAADTARFVATSLQHPDGGFVAATWREGDAWLIDPTSYADQNARAAKALLRASRLLGDLELARCATRSIERLAPALYRRSAGMAHYLREQPGGRGLLGDQVWSAAALIDAFAATDDLAYRDLADELMRSAWVKYWTPDWGWHDRLVSLAGAGDVGLLAMPLVPFVTACEAAQVFDRLARLTDDLEHAERADAVLRSLVPHYAAQGVDAAAFALALVHTAPASMAPHADVE
ncbi:MAG: DUF255 domain-containing protein [Vicinamibacterales bacterium]